ncbi:MAG: uracil-xanthine permease [Bacilli bacterium]|nr:uracil-xanthine permease [Bacilli bacterium]
MATRKLIYDVGDRPKFKNLLLYAFQMLLAILAATVAVPTIIGLPTQIPAAILGAGVGTLVYILFTKGKSPIVISSSFAFLPALSTALAFGYMGILVGGLFAGAVYVVLAIVVKFAGTKWVNKLMPPVIIGPVVALIGLSLAPNAVGDLMAANSSDPFASYNWVAILCGLVTLFTVVICTVQNRFKSMKLIPFIIGIGAGYALASIFTGIGIATNNTYLQIINWDPLINNFSNVTVNSFFSVPKISIVEGIKELVNGEFSPEIIAATEGGATLLDGVGVGAIALAFCPIAFVAFAEHLADHKNMSTIINHDLINDQPGLHRTLLGDGVGTMMGTACGICPNTSYGEGIACVALTRNASVATTFTTACICILLSFLAPFSLVLQTIPRCVMGGVCLALYGYISVSGLKMFKEVDLDDNANLLTVCAILIAGIGGLTIQIPYVLADKPEACKYITIGAIATALILGIIVYQLARLIHHREKSRIADINLEVREEDFVRAYLKQFGNDRLTKVLLMFGFLHESVELTTAQLSNILRSKEMLSLRTPQELNEIIKLFELKGNTRGLTKEKLIDLIVYDCQQIDKNTPNKYLVK